MPSPTPMAILAGANDCIHDVNEAWIQAFGFERDAVLGKTGVELDAWSEQDRKGAAEALRAAGGELCDFEARLQKKAGVSLDFLAAIESSTMDDKPIHLSVLHDVTRRKQGEDALIRANDELEQRVAQRTRDLVLAKEAAEAADRAKS
ncbi:MAG: PAS domain-containing hybrid sensor histidine kinase/response regulator [Alphaproteobacteria bacterium]|nr:PAS domain-containing hybrid sensor histidine kinase/response regulator [Alphaproteobacteria bacterium]